MVENDQIEKGEKKQWLALSLLFKKNYFSEIDHVWKNGFEVFLVTFNGTGVSQTFFSVRIEKI